MKATEWYKEMKEDFGEVDISRSSDFNYRLAWENGVHLTAARSPIDNKIHMFGSFEDKEGNIINLKSPEHKTRWKSDLIQLTGINADEEGLTKEEGLKLIEEAKRK